MRCETCPMLGPIAPTPGDPEVVACIEDCDDCPIEHGASCSPEAAAFLLLELRRQLTHSRRQQNRLKKTENEMRELREQSRHAEERMRKLEEVQKTSTQQSDAELKTKMDLIGRQQAAILELSSPVIQVADGVLVLPLVGSFDDERAKSLSDNLLDELRRRGARVAILDLTGLGELDATRIRHIVTLERTVRLLGAKVILCGLRPHAARALASLDDTDFGSIVTTRDLQEALRQFGGEVVS